MSKNIKLGIIIDPLESLNTKKDSSYAMILEAWQRNWTVYTITPDYLYTDNSTAYGLFNEIQPNTQENKNPWYRTLSDKTIPLNDLDIILIRKDPPFNMEYIYLTYILDTVDQNQTLIANNPTAIRNNNEKLATLHYPEVTPPCLVSANKTKLLEFIKQHGTIIVKPLDSMGGRSIFKINLHDDNTSVILDTITQYGKTTIMAQKFIPEIKQGDKRILLINGEPVPYGLARVPAEGEFRGNLNAGAEGIGFELTERDKDICNYIGPSLKEQGLYFVGIDVIGEYLTEVNVTSPTCIQELDKLYGLNISKDYLDCLESLL